MLEHRSLLIGSFDGFHLGHRYLTEQFVEKSKAIGLAPTVLTYHEHPLKLLKPELENFYLDSEKTRLERLKKNFGTIVLEFEKHKSMTALEFFSELKRKYSNIKHVFLGHDSSFGKDKISDIKILRSMDLFEFTQLDAFPDFKVSSTLVREAIWSADFDGFKKLTSREYRLRSNVIPGKQIGRTIGFPTANLEVDLCRARLPNGVYSGEVRFEANKYKFVANIGVRPTIDSDKAISIEAHLLEFDQDIYGKTIELFINRKVRDIKQFKSRMELMQQIAKDIKDVEQG